MKQIVYCCLIVLSLFASCKKENNNENTKTEKINAPGFGTSTAAFTGINWQLPQGIVLKDSIRESSWWTDVHGGTAISIGDFGGLPGGAFTVCLYLQNTTGQTITIQFPQELLIFSNTIHTQNGVIISLGTITIPAHSEKVVIAGAFCINLQRSVPDLHTDQGNLQAFSFGPATVPAQLKEISDILKPKNITYKSITTPGGSVDPTRMAKLTIIQSAIWDATDGEGITAETKDALRSINL